MPASAARRVTDKQRQQSTTESDRVALVDQLWKLKKKWQEHTGSHIPLNLLIKEVDYRRDVLDSAINSGNPALEGLARRIRVIEERVGEISSITSQQQASKASPYFFAGVLALVIGAIALAGTLMYQSGVSSRALLPASDPLIEFRLHGSNTVGEELAPALLKSFFDSQGALEVLVAGSDIAVEDQVQFVMPDTVPMPRAVELHAHGSSTSFRDLAAGTADMGMSSRPIKPAEIEELREKFGDLSAPGREHVIALDGLAVIVNAENPVSQLTKAEIAAVFSGEVRDWSELGGAPGAINIHARDDNSGTYDTFKSLVLKPNAATLAAAARRYESSTELADEVAADPNAIGFIGLPYVRSAKALGVAESPETPAVVPTEFTVSTEDYPLSRRLYFYVPATVSNELVRDFVQFTISDAGQTVVDEVGLIPQLIRMEQPRPYADAPPRFQQLTANAQRLSVSLRFTPTSDRLDNKGIQDIDRIVQYMKQNRQRELMLLSFTDNTGDAAAEMELSRARAQTVAQMLIARGLYPAVTEGFGAALPVASNESDAGRHKNRRVEVWIR